MKLYAPEDYTGTLMCLEEAVGRAEETGCRVVCVYREATSDDIDADWVATEVVEWLDELLGDFDDLVHDDGRPHMPSEESPAVRALRDAVRAVVQALDLSEAAWQHERDIWLPEWPGGCRRLWGTRCDVAPVGPSWHPAQQRARRTCRFERHGNPIRPMPNCEVPA